MLLRWVELAACLMFIAWTVVFPLATLLSLLVTVPMFALLLPRPSFRPHRLAGPVQA